MTPHQTAPVLVPHADTLSADLGHSCRLLMESVSSATFIDLPGRAGLEGERSGWWARLQTGDYLEDISL